MSTICCEKPKFDFSKLRGRIKEVLGTEGELAKRINRTHGFVSSALNGNTYFTMVDMDNIANVLGIEQSEYGVYFFTKMVLK